jgi:hypothetical protein
MGDGQWAMANRQSAIGNRQSEPLTIANRQSTNLQAAVCNQQ